jgi:hypothetical protein
MTGSALVMARASGAIGRRFEAIVFDWEGTAVPDARGDATRVGRLLEKASSLGIEIAVRGTATGDLNDQLSALSPARPGDLVLALWRRGIAPEQVLLIGNQLLDAPAGVVQISGEVDVLAAVLDDQIARRQRGDLPIVAQDPAWTIVLNGVDPLLERVHESLLTLADGRLGTRGSVIVEHPSGDPAVLMFGIYTGTGSATHLLRAARWNTIAFDGAAPRARRVLDLHTGLLHQELVSEDGRLDALLFSSLARPGTSALRVRDRSGRMRRTQPLHPPASSFVQGEADGCSWIRVTGRPGSLAAAAHDHLRGTRGDQVLDRIGQFEGLPRGKADQHVALERISQARELGFDGLLAEHRRSWAARWEDADVLIDGDPELQFAVRFAIFHLLASAPDEGEAAVGARGLSGNAYRGHVFWDSDVYVLPFLAATHPSAARGMLEYRVRRLPAAAPRRECPGTTGARFPWESAHSDQDVTPKQARDRRGELVQILTGRLEEHIVADVAWAAACYIDWTGDQAFAAGEGREPGLATSIEIEVDPEP